MNRQKLGGLTTMARWRKFAKAQASIAFSRRNNEAECSRQELDAASDQLDRIQLGHARMLEARYVDLTRLKLAVGLEEVAWNAVEIRRGELRAAEASRDTAQVCYVEARAQTRIVEARRERLADAENASKEKVMFDWMAVLYEQTRMSR